MAEITPPAPSADDRPISSDHLPARSPAAGPPPALGDASGGAEAFDEIARELVAELSLDRLFPLIVGRASRLFAGDCGIYLVTDDRRLVPQVDTNPDMLARPLRVGEGLAGRCAERRQGALGNDYPSQPDAAPWAVAYGLRHVMVQPLLIRGHLHGVISVSRREPAAPPFTDEDLLALDRFAHLAALSLRNATLYEDLRRRRQEAEELGHVARALTGVLDVSQVASRVVESILALFPGGAAVVAGLGADGVPVVLASDGPSSALFPPGHRPVPGGLVERVVTEQRILWSTDLTAERMPADPRHAERRRLLLAAGLRAVLALPLVVRGRATGVLGLTFATPRSFGAADVALIQAVADQAALALENARLYEESEGRRREAEVLAALAGSIGASLEQDTVLRRVVDGARELCGSDMACIALREPGDAAVLTLRCGVGYRRAGLGGARIEAGHGLGGQVLLTERPLRTVDLLLDPRFREQAPDLFQEEGVTAQLAVPIHVGDRVEGVLYVDRRGPRPFTERDEARLSRLAEHAAIAIGNAQLFAERRRAEAALRESEQRYRLLADNVADVLVVFDLDLRVRYVSPSVLRLCGYTVEEAMRTPFEERITAASREEMLRVLAEELALERAGRAEPARTRTLELEQRCKNGSTVWTETTLTFLRGEDGQPSGIVGVARNVTARKHAEAALRRSEEQLRHAQKMEAVGLLAGGVAHDFNNLLTVIGGRTSLALSTLDAAAPERRPLELVEETVKRATLLTKQLLAVSRRQVLEPRVLDPNQLLQDMGRILRPLIGEDIDLRISDCAGLGQVHADPGQLEQVLLNLAVNARDAMPKGGRLLIDTASVDLDEAGAQAHGGARPGPYVVLRVEDTGMGMDEETRAHIFEPFFTTKGLGKGTGLGLSTVYGIVQQSGGFIEVVSEQGVGTTFRVYLPRLEAEAETPETDVAAGTPPRGAETILVVEDDPELRSLVRELLELQGHRILEAVDGRQAFEVALAWPGTIDLLLTDVVMPGLRGDELARTMLGAGRTPRVLYMSGYAENAQLSPDALLQKPFSPHALVRKVRELLDRA